MAASTDPLGPPDAGALRALLTKDPAHNLHFLGLLEEFGFVTPSDDGRFAYYGFQRQGELTAALFVGNRGSLVVPAATHDGDLAQLCESLAGKVQLRACVGDRAHVQAVLRAFGGKTPKLDRELRLFKVSADDLGPFTNPTLRLATEADLPRLLPLAAGTVREIFSRDPLVEDTLAFEDRVRQRVRGRRTYVLEEAGALVFKIDVGPRSQFGAELEGLFTSADERCKGHATLSLGQICRHLLSSIPRLVLRVPEESPIARMARKVGFVPGRAHRLIVIG